MPSEKQESSPSTVQRPIRRLVVASTLREYAQWLREEGVNPSLCRYIATPDQLRGMRLGPELQLVKLPGWILRRDRWELDDAMKCLEKTSA